MKLFIKKYKNYLSKIINKAERYYYSQYFITNRNNPKQIWNKINTIIHNNKNGNIVPNVIEDNKRCEQFNDYFCNIGEKLASKSEKIVIPIIHLIIYIISIQIHYLLLPLIQLK